jgi:hypothetical protein
MTSKEAIEILTARAEWAEKWALEWAGQPDAKYYGDQAAALRLAVRALEEKAEQESDDPRRAPTGWKGMTQ